MYKIIHEINENTFFAVKENRLYILKKIQAEDMEIYKKLQSISGRYIAKTVGFTSDSDALYAVLEYVSGETLYDYVKENGVLSDDEVKKLTLQICEGLKEIHSRGIIHRDINPNNIIIDSYGNAVIIDFGISRKYKKNEKSDTQILGTQGYAAPEQFGFTQTSCRSDIYSVGVLINFMKTGDIPLNKTANGVFEKIILKCTQIDENNRYRDIDALLNEIDSKRFRLKSRICSLIPGFRSGVWWHRLISVAYYFVSLMIIIIVAENDLKEQEFTVFVLDFFAIASTLFGVPFFIFVYGGKRNGYEDKGKYIFRKIVLSWMCVIVSLIFIAISGSMTK